MQNKFDELNNEQINKEFSNLNPMQKEACFTTEGPVLILAGAGSGKTTTLISRIYYMIKYKQISPYNILAITFTNKAANELKERLHSKLEGLAQGIWALTFHSACVRILREEIHNLNFNKYFTIYDSDDAKNCLKECIKELDISDKIINNKMAYAFISNLKNNYTSAIDFKKETNSEYKLELMSKIYDLYTAKLKKYNAVDFDDLIFYTVKIFSDFPAILERYQSRFKYIMIDEYQDTNKIQYMLVSLLAQKFQNICVVGDDDQSIYKFRGADITNILNFEKQFKNTKTIKLEENYRSTQNILNAANGVIKNNNKRKEKALWTQKTGGEQITHLTPSNNYDEAFKVQMEIEKHLDRGYSYKDMAILYRMNSLSRTFEQVFLKNAIPHRIVGGVRFFDRKEIKDIVAYLRLTLNNADDSALMRIINEPARGIGKTTIEKIQGISNKENISMLEVCKNANNYQELSSPKLKLMNFQKMILDFSENIDDVEKLINSVIYGSGYIDALKSEDTEESQNREKNIMELLSVIKENKKNNDLTKFLENVALLSDIDNYDAGEDAVTLMTLHSSKGLEFKIVFLVGFEDGIFPSNQSVNEVGGLEEERRLCYVGITRAKEILFVSSASERMLYGNMMSSCASRFLKEIPQDTLKLNFIPQYKNKIETINYTTPIIQPVKNNIPTNLPDYSVGIKVKHKKFGVGTILTIQPLGNDIKLEIDFADVGKKVLMAAFARPEII